ncbi:MAG TPA: tetratricopeptide repeat protein, partial [Casimicrobiaceae bacterium]
LEGIPLALELAAARVRSLAVADINKRLNDRYKLLTGGDRTLQARQQTLRALVDWSYDLLEENEQVLLARLSVFAGGFGLEAAETICGADPLEAMDVLDLITSLVEKSLLRVEEHDAGARYRMLETIREYADEKLALRDELAATRVAHCDYFLTFAKASNFGLQGPERADWLRQVDDALDDIRAGTRFALDRGVDPIIAVKFDVAMLGFWLRQGYITEGRASVRAALALPEVKASDVAHAHALYVGAGLAESQGDLAEASRMLEDCLALRRGIGKTVDIAATLSTLAQVRLRSGDAGGALANETEALALFRDIGNRVGEAIGLQHLGEIHVWTGDAAAAKTYLDECIVIAHDIGNLEVESECAVDLGEVALEGGDPKTALDRFSSALEIARAAGDKRGEAAALWRMGRASVAAGDLSTARTRLAGALRSLEAFEMRGELIECIEDCATLDATAGDPAAATTLYAAADAMRERYALTRPPQAERTRRNALDALRSDLGVAAFDAAWTAGAALEMDRALELARGALSREPALA